MFTEYWDSDSFVSLGIFNNESHIKMSLLNVHYLSLAFHWNKVKIICKVQAIMAFDREVDN